LTDTLKTIEIGNLGDNRSLILSMNSLLESLRMGGLTLLKIAAIIEALDALEERRDRVGGIFDQQRFRNQTTTLRLAVGEGSIPKLWNGPN
jgi:hypothetical protein